ncbi:MAG: PorV/PorQ family protein [candidate division KSB1 bacterium]|nr:PorV/PorQ family protein [candidate division KSB1 bacterium]
MKISIQYILLLLLILAAVASAQQPYRRGTTAANFLEIGYGSRGNAMGDAVVATSEDLESCYWNPAGLAMMRRNEVLFSMQPWVIDINTSFAAVGLVLPRYGVFALSINQMNYGKEKVTTLTAQDGTGENYTAAEFAFQLAYARKLTEWFSFGAGIKYINSTIWHVSANAAAIDLGALVNTPFFSPTGDRSDGLAIGMSIANYGTRMRYDGMDLLEPIDPNPNVSGNYAHVEGQYLTQSWELPLIFRIGVALHPIVTSHHRLTLEADALHPNNNSESVNLGAQYRFTLPSFGSFYLRAGYKGLFMDRSEYGPSYGFGISTRLSRLGLRIDYALRDIGLLGTVHAYTVSMLF